MTPHTNRDVTIFFLRPGMWFALADTGYVKTVCLPASHQWRIEELRSE